MSDDKTTQKIALLRAMRNTAKVLRELDDIAQDVDNIRPSIQQGFAAQAALSSASSLVVVTELLTSLYEQDYSC